MDVHRSFAIFAALALMAPAISLATEFVVGDGGGWGTDINYENWVKGKQFFVGDSLVFKYTRGDHNVYKVNGEEFKSCTVPSNNNSGLFTGNDTVKLKISGMKWYICGIPGHCNEGQKLKIMVEDAAPAPAPSAASTSFATSFEILVGMIFSIAAIVIVN